MIIKLELKAFAMYHMTRYTTVYPKASVLAAWSENRKW